MIPHALPHPLPASPIKGEVPSGGGSSIVPFGSILPFEWSETSPSDGGGRRGWGHEFGIKVDLQ